ncbi:MAG: ATP-dependent metallopeptidase FtsH/Yme1/Tma family protein [Acidobacteria bacterium]|nr:ATP-dependent metallopeptidase FtsH/Yme1/Tma family protein [Acidobacteriota bacterium]
MTFGFSFFFTSLLVIWLFQQFMASPLLFQALDIPYSDFRARVKAGQLVEVTIGGQRITGEMRKSAAVSDRDKTISFDTVAPPDGDPRLLDELDAAGVKYRVTPAASPIGEVISWLLPLNLLGFLWYTAYGRTEAVGGGIIGVGRSRATKVAPEEVGVTYEDLGGADEAIAELREIIQFLKTPAQFARLGGKIPKGVLLVGPPGTGKTLIAKATAGEAHVPFFEMSGSEFVEMFVGVGAARVRDLFEHARRVAPAIVFIDEIDAVGQSRGTPLRLGANEEREQTLNQLLAEIDGFKADVARPVIIMAATNRPEVLDPALLRAGRFDRQVVLGNPDLVGREQILRIHTRTIKLASNFDLTRAARVTPGFSGADLANVVNEAALLAARRSGDAVAFADFETAMERVVAGLEKRTRVMNELERRAVACHECGHALVAQLVPHGDPVSKVSIVPRSRGALGYTLQMPAEDRYLLTAEQLEDRLAVMLGGRAAEKIVLGTISTGASDDIQRATELARRMVTEFGMSEKLGSVRYAGPQLQFLGGAPADMSQLSPHTRDAIDSEVQRIVDTQYARAQRLLNERRAALESLMAQLLKSETLDGSVVRLALEGHQQRPGTEVLPRGEARQRQPLLPA